MTWTYSSTSVTTNLARVRLALGDTIDTDPLLTDEEIAAQSNYTASELASTSGVNIPLAAYRCIGAMQAAVARRIDTSGPRFGATRSQVFMHFRDLRAQLKSESRATVAPVSWSEHSIDDAADIESDSDFNPPAFGRGMFDNVTDDEA